MKRIVCSGDIDLTLMTCSTGWEVEVVYINSLDMLDPVELGQMLSLGFGLTFTVLFALHPLLNAIKAISDIIRYGEKQ